MAYAPSPPLLYIPRGSSPAATATDLFEEATHHEEKKRRRARASIHFARGKLGFPLSLLLHFALGHFVQTYYAAAKSEEGVLYCHREGRELRLCFWVRHGRGRAGLGRRAPIVRLARQTTFNKSVIRAPSSSAMGSRTNFLLVLVWKIVHNMEGNEVKDCDPRFL